VCGRPETGRQPGTAFEGEISDAALTLHQEAIGERILADRELGGAVKNTRLVLRKQREGAAGLELPFAPKTVEIGTDSDVVGQSAHDDRWQDRYEDIPRLVEGAEQFREYQEAPAHEPHGLWSRRNGAVELCISARN
jgi:hypothetical protein